uniref:Uncharacterized protein n=1 Tax=Glossina palpalis gambiensis TaxID=67801 RepID=A0A1B0BYY0_9MUSC
MNCEWRQHVCRYRRMELFDIGNYCNCDAGHCVLPIKITEHIASGRDMVRRVRLIELPGIVVVIRLCGLTENKITLRASSVFIGHTVMGVLYGISPYTYEHCGIVIE